MTEHATGWWLVGRAWLGQSAFGPPALAWVHRGLFTVVGPRGRSVFHEPAQDLRLELTGFGNLRVRAASGTGITLLPSDPRGTPIGRRMLAHLPPEVAGSPGASPATGDPLGRQFAAAFHRDASGPTTRIAEVLVANGAVLGRREPYSPARVWLTSAAVLALIVLATLACTYLLFS